MPSIIFFSRRKFDIRFVRLSYLWKRNCVWTSNKTQAFANALDRKRKYSRRILFHIDNEQKRINSFDCWHPLPFRILIIIPLGLTLISSRACWKQWLCAQTFWVKLVLYALRYSCAKSRLYSKDSPGRPVKEHTSNIFSKMRDDLNRTDLCRFYFCRVTSDLIRLESMSIWTKSTYSPFIVSVSSKCCSVYWYG